MSTFEKLCNEYRENKRLIEELNAMNDELKSDILSLMGTEETHVEGTAKVTNKTVISSRFDSTGFKKAYPALFTEYSRETEYKRFCVL
jgi:predicted phage-related endonuclease